MASTQVLPNNSASVSKKQGHLEAGKRRLEEFRKKKAADRAKKAAVSGQLHAADVGSHEKQYTETEQLRVTESDGAGTSDGFGSSVVESSVVTDNNNDREIESPQNNYLGSYGTHSSPLSLTNHSNSFSTETMTTHAKDPDFNKHNMVSDGPVNVYYSPQMRENNDDTGMYNGASGVDAYGTVRDQSITLQTQTVQEIAGNSSKSINYSLDEARIKDNENDFAAVNPGSSHFLPEKSGSNPLLNKFGSTSPLATALTSSSYEDTNYLATNRGYSSSGIQHNMWGAVQSNSTMSSDTADRKSSGFGSHSPASSIHQWPPESQSSGFSFDVTNSSNHVSPFTAVSETNTRRSRPSFLDSITVSRVSSATHTPVESQNVESLNSKLLNMDARASPAFENSLSETERVEPFNQMGASRVSNSFEKSLHSVVSAGNGSDLYRNNITGNTLEKKDDFYSRKHDEDFAALEQHIEDLTQEKFSLQRALEASRALSESLATENSALTDSYNQQGSVVNQLKADMETLQQEIKSQLMEVESLKIEYGNAQLECNASDERAKMLASEVINLEEKALRLRSSELKLERQLENSQAEVTSFKKKVSSLEKDRQDLQSTIDALQEEKKLLQAKLRKATSGKLIDVGKSPTNKKDVSTSTEDLVQGEDITADNALLEMHNSAPRIGSDNSGFPLLAESGQFNLEFSSLNIPPDQVRTIQNINTLISELALERKELTQALVAESSQSSKLKEVNKDLSRKLESQTQRLELLTAQSMATVSASVRQPPDSLTIPDNNIPYADEGDEVVERVLGWIMKLFPGGPSRRRTSKRL